MSSIAAASLWDFAQALYAEPGLADYCLDMQDSRGVDVNLLLFAAWLSVRGAELTEQRLAQVIEAGRCWREAVIVPLRQVRRRVKTEAFELAGEQQCYEAIKAAELAAEKVAIDQLQTLAEPWPSGLGDTELGNVDRYLRAAGVVDVQRAVGLGLLRTVLSRWR